VQEPSYDRHAERALLHARDEAAKRNEPRIGPDHLFIGLVREHEGGAARLLAEFGIDLDRARYRVGPIKHPPARPPGSPGWEPPGFTRLLRTALEWAEQEATRLQQSQVQTEHLLLGLMVDPIHGGSGLLRTCGADPDVVWNRTYGVLGVDPQQRRPRPEPPPYKPPQGWGPLLTDLRRVVPIAESRTGGGHTLTLRSLEDYTDGFLVYYFVRCYVNPDV
jgi:ATP-dependent Clp protease ATP-binding subunit ClpA